MDIIQYFNQHHPLPQEVNDALDSLFRTEGHSKGEIILRPKTRSQKLIFVEKGLIRLYYEKEEKDITFLFLDENSFSAPIENIFYNRPTQYGWQVLEDCTIRMVNYNDFENLLLKFPLLERIARVVLIDTVKMISDKLYALQFQTAEQRYNFMLENYPNILLRVPLGHIASYLGITQQTLSVIRAKI